MSEVYRARFVAGLRKFAKEKDIKLQKKLTDKLFEKQWVVYAKRPFGNVNSVIEYLGRYTHRVAISNHRIIDIKDGEKEVCSLTANEFLRRFCMHILPKRFSKKGTTVFCRAEARKNLWNRHVNRLMLKLRIGKIQIGELFWQKNTELI